MKFSENWLREKIKLDISQAQLIAQMTMAGLEVDDVSPVAQAFQGIVVGEVVECGQHPNADKLRVCKVNVGEEALLDIVCGASNVRAGLKVACAKVGATLGADFKIKKAKLRGEPSHGMLCSASELGFADTADGIIELAADAPLGQDIREYLQLDDYIIDVDLTPNRGDCLSIEGIARDMATVNRVAYQDSDVAAVPAQSDTVFPVNISAFDACPHYVGRIIEGINLNVSSPVWLQERLRRSGMRPIDPVVDVTNYVMLEMGQPMHAFDLDSLSGGIEVRMAKAGEIMTLLDGNDITLDETCLLITDEKEILALAGVMGAENSGINEQTQSIFLESAFFSPTAIAGRARSFGLHTESSHRYERGVSPDLQVKAIERATQLLLEIVGGTPGPLINVKDEAHIPAKSLISLRPKRIEQVLGVSFSDDEVLEILQGLGMTVYSQGEKWEVQVPLRRFDISIEEDLIEELARIYGYDNIPAVLPRDDLSMHKVPETQVSVMNLKQCLLELGYSEAISYSFICPKWQSHFVSEMNSPRLVNPLSPELSQMRQSLWPGLVQAVQYNQNRQQETLRLFESGLRFFYENETIRQQRVIAGVACGQAQPEQWGAARRDVDFFDVKASVESLLALTADEAGFSFVAETHTALHPGQSAKIMRGDQVIGWMGAIHPKVEKALDLDGPIYVFELYCDGLEAAKLPRFEALSKFPAIRRDLALVADDKIPAGEIMQQIKLSGDDLVKEVTLFDIYQGPGVAEGKRSLALALTLQHGSRTLIDQEVTSLIDSVVQSLHDKLGVTLRE